MTMLGRILVKCSREDCKNIIERASNRLGRCNICYPCRLKREKSYKITKQKKKQYSHTSWMKRRAKLREIRKQYDRTRRTSNSISETQR